MSNNNGFEQTLIKAGITPQQAQILASHFGNEPGFLEGLDLVARILAGEAPSITPPAGEPWGSVFGKMRIMADPHKAYNEEMVKLPGEVQFILAPLVMDRIAELKQIAAKTAPPGKRPKTDNFINALRSLGFIFKYNQVTNEIEVNGKPLNDPTARLIEEKMTVAGYGPPRRIENAYMIDAYTNRYHPIKDYLHGLKYDGGSHIEELGNHFTDKHGMFTTFFRRWLIGAIAKVMAAEQNPMLVLEGPQRLGKSEFVKWLASPNPEYFIEGAIDTNDKDTYKRLMSTWIWEVSELGATTRKSDREALKAFITMRKVTVRLPYAKYDTTGPAMANLIGTINNDKGFLSDPTGSRRFISVKLEHIDWSYKQNCNPDDIWAEAFAQYLAGEPWELTEDERGLSQIINEEFEIDDPIEGILYKFFKIDPQETSWFTSTVEIMEVLEDPTMGKYKGGTRATAMALAETMTRLKLAKGRQYIGKQRVNGYFGIATKP